MHLADFGVEPDMFILIELRGSLAAFQLHCQYLVGEMAIFYRILSPAVAGDGQFVLLFPVDPPFFGDIFGRDAHVVFLHRTMQRTDHHVEQLSIAQPVAEPGTGRQITTSRHRLGSACHRGVAHAKLNLLRRRDDRLHAATAQPVHGHARRGMMQPSLKSGDTRDVHVPGLGMDDVADHAMSDVFRIDPGSSYGFLDNKSPQLSRGVILEASSKITDCGSDPAYHYYFVHDKKISVPR